MEAAPAPGAAVPFPHRDRLVQLQARIIENARLVEVTVGCSRHAAAHFPSGDQYPAASRFSVGWTIREPSKMAEFGYREAGHCGSSAFHPSVSLAAQP